MKYSDNVIYCDNHILVAYKPSGWLTQPDGTDTINLEAVLKAWLKKTFQKSGDVFLHAIHRIDRPVSGIVLWARTSKALSRLNEQVRSHQIRRFYIADVEGELLATQGELKHKLVHGHHRAYVSSSGQEAHLSYQVQNKSPGQTRLWIELYTGRYHQIRAQCAAIGHPIVGDTRYGGKLTRDGHIHLHSARIELIHPVTKLSIYFEVPADF